MIEKLMPLDIPPGIITNGTMEDRTGRWADGNFVRFVDNKPVPIGGVGAWSGDIPSSGGVPTGAWTWWLANQGSQRLVIGKQTKLYVTDTINPTTFIDATPAALSDLGVSNVSWAFTNLGNILVFSRAKDTLGSGLAGNLWKWDPSVGGASTAVTNAPTTTVHGVVVTPEQFLMVLLSDRTIQWASQGTLTTWAPTGTNSAGDLDIPTDGILLKLIVLRGETLALSSVDAWSVDYVGGSLYYGARKIGEHCGIIGPNAGAAEGSTLYWMGVRGFFQYDGYVRPVKCDVSEAIFSDFNYLAAARIFTISVPTFNEIWWFYPTAGQTTPNRCVRYNTEQGTWILEPLTRAAGVDAVLTNASPSNGNRSPILIDANGTDIWFHEYPTTPVVGAFVESGPIRLGEGDHTMRVQKLVPDGAKNGDDITLYAGGFPGQAETSTTVAISATPGPIDVRFVARYVRYKQTLESLTSLVGIPSLGVIESSSR